ncbi:hypothetical protein F9K33_16510 [bacterium]|nr:MAG: hypothetical protein F9K33_16510 [bacterium]
MNSSKMVFFVLVSIIAAGSIGCDQKSHEIISAPTVATLPIANITAVSASSGGDVNDDGNAIVTARGVCWSKAPNPTIADSNTIDSSGTGSYQSVISGLSPNETYFVKAYATNSVGTSYGDEVSFTTNETIPQIITDSITNITDSTASCGGNVIDDGGATVAARGICWSPSQNPSIADNKTTDGSGTGIFSSNITGLSPNTIYYVKAYATNTAGTSYGSQVSFVTLAVAPTVITSPIISVWPASASGGGNVTDDGGAPVIAMGVCWSPSQNPTIADNKTSDGLETGSFASHITGLAPSTTYYVKAYATNSIGTNYGLQETFTTSAPYQTGTFTDPRDGRLYQTVTVGTQTWMSENLEYRTSSGSWYYNDDSSTYHTYGRLYTWDSALTSSPPGWHLPSITEWTTLISFLGGTDVAGGKLKEAGVVHWTTPNAGATNESGFTAIPGGYRGYQSNFDNVGYNCTWWSATGNPQAPAAYAIALNYENPNVGQIWHVALHAFNVRCIKD